MKPSSSSLVRYGNIPSDSYLFISNIFGFNSSNITIPKLKKRIEHLVSKGFLGVLEEVFSRSIFSHETTETSLQNICKVLRRAEYSGNEAKEWLINEINDLIKLQSDVFSKTAKQGRSSFYITKKKKESFFSLGFVRVFLSRSHSKTIVNIVVLSIQDKNLEVPLLGISKDLSSSLEFLHINAVIVNDTWPDNANELIDDAP